MTENELDKVAEEANKELAEKEPEKKIEKTNPNKDLVPQRVQVPGLGYVDMIGTIERDEVMTKMKSMVFKIMNLAFAIDSIDIENGTFTAKLMNYHPGIVPEEIKEEPQEQ